MTCAATLRSGASDQALREQITAIWTQRTDRYSEQRTRADQPQQHEGGDVAHRRLAGQRAQ